MTAFEEYVREALDQLPVELASELRNVAIVVEDEHPDEPGLLGLYEGVPLTERGGDPLLPDQITIFRRPLERSARNEEELREQIRVTVLHEIGHYFGFDEGQLDELGYA